MTKSLLAERFKLASHNESRELPIFALVIAKNGPKLKESAADEQGKSFQIRWSRSELSATEGTTARLAELLSNHLSREVLDQTGLKGKYDFQLKWTPDDAPGDGPSIYTAIQEQLGLKLEPEKSRVNVMVIDHAEKASEN